MSIESDVQKSYPGDLVELYILDASEQGVANIVYFTAGTISGVSAVVHGGITYSPWDVMIEGMQKTIEGTLPEPTISVSNVSKTIQAEVIAYNDLLGAKLTRRRTFTKYLDGMPEANSGNVFPDDVYYFEQKVLHNKAVIQWKLNSIIDYEGKQLPGMIMLKDTCTWRYREYDTTTGGFDYTNSTCPYTGALVFDADGNVTTSGDDSCGHRLTDCELRYPNKSDELPYGGFPGISKTRV